MRQIATHLAGGDVESSDELYVANVIAAELEMHNPRDRRMPGSAAIEFDPLDERGGAISDAHDGDPDLRQLLLLLVPYASERRTGVRRRTTQNAISSIGCATIPMTGPDR